MRLLPLVSAFTSVFTAGLLVAPGVRAQAAWKLQPGAAAAYEGTVKLKKSTRDGGSESEHRAFDVCRARLDARGKSRLLAVRILKSADGQEEPLCSFEDVSVTPSEKGFAVDSRAEAPADLEENARRVQVLFPFDLLPTFEISAADREIHGEAEVSVLGVAKVKAPLVTGSRRDGSRLEVTRKLETRTESEFELDGSKARLLAWSESYTFDAEGGLPVRVDTTTIVETGEADSKLRVERTSLLEAKKSNVPADSAAKLDAIEDALRELGAAFAAIRPPEEIAKRVATLESLSKGSIFEPAMEAFRSRLAAYREAGLGSIAPDFTLESLEGRQVTFREATRGKVVLLSFWGVGCPPCCKEAPHLTKLQEKYAARGFTVLAVNGWDETKEVVQQFVDKEHLKHPVLLMGGEMGAKLFHVDGFPTSVLINREGRIVHREMGFDPEVVPEIEKRIEKLLATRP